MVLDIIQHYKVEIKGKVEKSCEWSSAPLHLGVVAIEKEAFGSPLTEVANFTYIYIYIYLNKSDLIIRNISFMSFIFWSFTPSFDLRSLSGEKIWVKRIFFRKFLFLKLLICFNKRSNENCFLDGAYPFAEWSLFSRIQVDSNGFL